MNKLFTKIATLSVGLAMAIGVGVAVGGSDRAAKAEATEQSVTFNLLSTGSDRTSKTEALVKFEKGNNYISFIRVGSNTRVDNYMPGGATNNTTQMRVYTGNSVEFGVGTGYVITRIAVTGNGNNPGGLNTGSNYTPTATISTSGNVWTAEFATAVQTQTVTATTTATGRLTQVVVYYDEPSAEPTLAIDKSSIKVANGYDATFTVTTANLSSNFSISGGDATYFSASYTASSADGEHVVTLHGNKATTSPITLTVSATGATSQTIDVSVEDPSLFEKVTAASEIKAGREIVIASTDGTAVLGKYVSGNNCPALTNEPDNNGKLISTYLPDGYALLTVGGTSGAWTLIDQDDNIYYGVSGENQLKANSSSTDTWSISVASSGVATITSAASSRSIKKNGTSSLFNTYQSGQHDVSIYMVPTTDPEIQVAVTGSQSLGVGETAKLTATKLNGATGTVTWATSNSSILSLSAASGDEVTVTAGSTLGGATITASLSGCDDVVTSFTVRRGSATEPYTVAQAKTAIDGSDAGAKTGVYVSGIISQVDSLNSDNSITYWISDNGTTANQMEVYKGFGLESATFSSVDDLQTGDEVVVYGDIKLYTPNNGDPVYEFNSGNYLYSFNRPVIELDTITSIEGELTADAGDDAWDLSGLTVKGTYTGSATVVDVTALVDLSTSDVPGTPASTTVRNVSVTATGKDDSTITLTQNVQGTINVMSGLVAVGEYRIKATRDSVTYYLKENGTTAAPSAVTDFWEATIFTFTLVDDDTYTISHGENYLYCTSTNNGVRFGDTSTATNERWTISAGESTLEGSYNLYSASGSRYLSLYNAADWRGYDSATANNRKENTDLQAFDAVQYASEFLSTYTAGCNVNGGYTEADMKWSTANTQYGFLSSANKTLLTGAQYTKSGSGSNTVVTATNGTNQTVAEAAARYDYVVGKNGTATFTDFMTRNPAPIANSSNVFGVIGSESTEHHFPAVVPRPYGEAKWSESLICLPFPEIDPAAVSPSWHPPE